MANSRSRKDIMAEDKWNIPLSKGMQDMNISSQSISKCRVTPANDCLEVRIQKNGSSSTSESNSPDGNITMYSSSESWSMAQDFINSGSPTLSSPRQGNLHHRSGSHRGHRPRYFKQNMVDDFWDIGDVRPRVFSMPVRSTFQCQKNITSCDSLGEVSRVRSFMITSKGLVNQGEYFLKRSVTPEANDAKSSAPDTKTTDRRQERSIVRVVILGSSGVGRHSLINAFVKDHDSHKGGSFDDEAEKSVSILLDGEETTMEFVDFSNRQVDNKINNESVDAFVVVYSVEDRRSYEASINRLLEVREELGPHVTLILVANKTDLVRSRVLTEEEGRAAAKTYDSKYIEVSAAIGHNINELLVGVLKQIRLFRQKHNRLKERHSSTVNDSCCLLTARENVLAKLCKLRRRASKSCNNLYV